MKLAFGFVSVVLGGLILTGCDQAKSKAVDQKAAAKVDAKVPETVAADKGRADAKGITIGDKAPDWKDLTGTDDKQHSLKDFEKNKAVAIVFTCNTCPVAQAYEDRLIKLANDYHDKGVAIVAINVNKDSHDDLDAMKQRAEQKGFPFAYLSDPSQQSGRSYGATCTPHVFLLDGERKVAYTGAIDDDMNADAVKHHSLQDAIDAVLGGKAPAVTTTKQFGCGIQYE
jgi:peroxiredoxin